MVQFVWLFKLKSPKRRTFNVGMQYLWTSSNMICLCAMKWLRGETKKKGKKKRRGHKHLGVTFESSGSWHKHIQLITPKSWQRIHIMRKLKFHLDRKSLDIIYTSFIRHILEYADVVLCNF